MDLDEARAHVLSEHRRLREQLGELVAKIDGFEAGSREVGGELRRLGIAFFEAFAAHIGLEDAALVPILRQRGEQGERQAERLAHEHREQRELLRYLLGRLEDEDKPSSLIARELRSFAEYVRQDMDHEERTILAGD